MNIKTILKQILNKIISINSNKMSKDQFESVFCTFHTLEKVSVSNGSNWTNSGYSAYICGTNLRFYCEGTRKSASGTGNITNEQIGVFKFNHGGKITGVESVTRTNGYTGPTQSIGIQCSNSGDVLTITVNLNSTHSAVSSNNIYVIIPVSIDISKFPIKESGFLTDELGNLLFDELDNQLTT